MEQSVINDLTIDNHTFKAPKSWDDLNRRSLLSCYHIIMQETGSLFLPAELVPAKRMLLLQHLCNISEGQFDTWQADRVAAHGEEDGTTLFFFELSECLRFSDGLFDIDEDEEGIVRYQLSLSRTKCPWPKIMLSKKHGRKKYLYAPEDGLANASIYEMSMLFSTFENYLAEQNEDDLDRLIAILYRPGKPETKANKRSGYQGDRRLPLLHHEATIDKRMRKVSKLEPLVKQVIVFWFASCRQIIINQFPNLFDSPQESSGPDPFGWGGVLLALADGLHNLDNIAQQKYSNALVYLTYLNDQRRKQEEAMERVRNN